MSFYNDTLDALLAASDKRSKSKPVPDENGVVDMVGEDEIIKKTSITAGQIFRWAAGILAIFGAGYVLRGVADSTNGTASLLDAIKGRNATPDVPFGMWGGHPMMGGMGGMGMGQPPTPEEISYWATFYRRGSDAMQVLAASMPKLPEVEHEPLAPPSPEEKAAERALLNAGRSAPRPRNPWGYGGGYGSYGSSYDYLPPPPSQDEFTIVKE
jgi:hypothetical protein